MKHKKIIILSVIFSVVAAIFTYRFYVVNSRYEKVKTKEYKVLETFECNGLNYTVTGKELIEATDYKDAKIMCIRLNVKNNSSEDIICDLTDCKMDFNNNSYFIRSEYFYEKNDENIAVRMNVPPDDVFTVTLPYIIFEEDLPAGKWSNVNQAKCELVFQLYPTKISVNLKALWNI